MSNLTRRHFIALVSCAAGAACCGATDLLAEDAPNVAPVKEKSLDAGPVTTYDKDGITDTFAKSHQTFIIRQDNQIYATSSICSHKRKALKLKDGNIWCPAHGSTFSEHGTVTKGPAKFSLPRYGVSVNDSGNLIVDLTKTFIEKEWETPGAFVAVKV